MVKLSRLIILLMCFIVPAIILAEFIIIPFTVSWFPSNGSWGVAKNILLTWVAPILFTGSWVYVLIIFAKRLADALDIMNETSSVIPQRYVLFYSLNALFILLVYLIPLITPIVCALAFMSLMFRIITSKHDWSESQKVSPFIKFVVFIAAFPAIFISAMVIPDLLTFSGLLWSLLWNSLVYYLYNFSIDFATALSFGAFIILFKTGIAEIRANGIATRR